ncbi:MAG: argininosuccinate lyase [Bacteroidota bacterium]
MMAKLWDKGVAVSEKVESFTVGPDRELDVLIAGQDVMGTMAHVLMLEEVGLLDKEELPTLLPELSLIYDQIQAGEFSIEEGVEDVHSQIEMMLTRKLGDIGKKIHSGRSRNDQVLVDLKLYFKDQIQILTELMQALFSRLQSLSERHKDILLPGYTHLQIAMPSSAGLWFGAYAESLVDDLRMLRTAYEMADQNPLGSAAGYGSSFPLNRSLTTALLGFSTMAYNVVYAQMGRGKTETFVAYALGAIGGSLNKLASDICLYMNQNFGFISFPDELTTGSSIMPHKKNPDVFEIMRARTNRLMSLPAQLSTLLSNLPSGYHRDLQLTKELLVPAMEEAALCLHMTDFMLEHIRVKEHVVTEDLYEYMFSVEEVNKLVLNGIPFREAYKQVGAAIAEGNFQAERKVHHTHEGSIGNLSTADIRQKWEEVIDTFQFSGYETAKAELLEKCREYGKA